MLSSAAGERWRCARLLISNTGMAVQKYEPPQLTASIQAQTAIIQPHVSTRIACPVDQLNISGCEILLLILENWRSRAKH